MANIVDISKLCPLKFMESGYSAPLPYNYRHFDDFKYQDTLNDLQEQINYFHPFQKNDILFIQILSNYAGPHQLILEDCEGTQIDSFAMAYVASSIEGTGQKVYEASIALTDYDEGIYRVVLKSGSPVIQTMESEYFEVKELHANSLLLEYSHSQNDFDVVFETGIVMRYRIPGWLTEYQPGAERVLFVDEEEDSYQLSGKAFGTQKLVIGGPEGVADWAAEKVNQIFLCDSVTIDGKGYVANDGAKLEAAREPLYPLAGWSMEVRRSDSSNKKRFSSDANQDSPLTVVYNIESKGFGPITGPASSNIIKIEQD